MSRSYASIDTETGRQRPRQLGTYPTLRLATLAARTALEDGATGERGTLGWLVRRYVESRTDVSVKTQEQYAWAAGHIAAGLGAVRLDRLDRADLVRWFAQLGAEGQFSRRSLAIFRNVLRMALNDAVDEGLIGRSPANRVPLPREVAKPTRTKEPEAWTEEEVARFLKAAASHRLCVGFRVAVLYGLRRSEVLALRWDDVDLDAGKLRIDEGLVATRRGAAWTNAKNARSRRTIPIDAATARAFALHRKDQAADRLVMRGDWQGENLILTSEDGTPLLPRSFDRSLEVVERSGGLPRLGSHGLRHTAATHMVAHAQDLGELRAVAQILGHSPEILLRIYAHAVPSSLRAVAEGIGARAAALA